MLGQGLRGCPHRLPARPCRGLQCWSRSRPAAAVARQLHPQVSRWPAASSATRAMGLPQLHRFNSQANSLTSFGPRCQKILNASPGLLDAAAQHPFATRCRVAAFGPEFSALGQRASPLRPVNGLALWLINDDARLFSSFFDFPRTCGRGRGPIRQRTRETRRLQRLAGLHLQGPGLRRSALPSPNRRRANPPAKRNAVPSASS